MLRNSEVLGQNAPGGMSKPFGNQEGLIFGKVAVVKDEKKFPCLLLVP